MTNYGNFNYNPWLPNFQNITIPNLFYNNMNFFVNSINNPVNNYLNNPINNYQINGNNLTLDQIQNNQRNMK